MKKYTIILTIPILLFLAFAYLSKTEICLGYDLFGPADYTMKVTVNNSPVEVDLRKRLPQIRCYSVNEFYFKRDFIVEVSIDELDYYVVDTVTTEFMENIRVSVRRPDPGVLDVFKVEIFKTWR